MISFVRSWPFGENVCHVSSKLSLTFLGRITALCAHQHAGLAMYFRRKTSAGRAYLQIVESRRDGDQVRQQVIATLGRFEELQASGSWSGCCTRARVLRRRPRC